MQLQRSVPRSHTKKLQKTRTCNCTRMALYKAHGLTGSHLQGFQYGPMIRHNRLPFLRAASLPLMLEKQKAQHQQQLLSLAEFQQGVLCSIHHSIQRRQCLKCCVSVCVSHRDVSTTCSRVACGVHMVHVPCMNVCTHTFVCTHIHEEFMKVCTKTHTPPVISVYSEL